MSIKTFVFSRIAKPETFRTDRPTSQSSRVVPLDGLRGLLALGVFLNHAEIYRDYLRSGTWTVASRWPGQMGQSGVTLFFMMTAFLFYGRLLAAQGRPDWRRLYLGRLFRIAPVYLLAIGALFAIVAAGSRFRLLVPPGQLAIEVASWLALGAGPRVDVNGYDDTRHLLAGVTWTLQSEWLFYASLPLLALAVRGGCGPSLAMPALGLTATLVWLASHAGSDFPACVAPFFLGMLCAALRARPGMPVLPDRAASIALLLLLAAFFGAGLDPRQPVALLLLGTAFWLVVNGGTVFGLLTSRPALWLGGISYGVYMLHGLVLSRFCAIGPVRAMALASPTGHWIMALLAAALVLILADLAHRLIEAPGIALGRRLAAARAPVGATSAAAGTAVTPAPAAAR